MEGLGLDALQAGGRFKYAGWRFNTQLGYAVAGPLMGTRRTRHACVQGPPDQGSLSLFNIRIAVTKGAGMNQVWRLVTPSGSSEEAQASMAGGYWCPVALKRT